MRPRPASRVPLALAALPCAAKPMAIDYPARSGLTISAATGGGGGPATYAHAARAAPQLRVAAVRHRRTAARRHAGAGAYRPALALSINAHVMRRDEGENERLRELVEGAPYEALPTGEGSEVRAG